LKEFHIHKDFKPFTGPLPKTITDFWWLVWQERISVVAMVTNVLEGGQQKCEQYWPSQGTQEYGPFKVTLTDQQVFADYTIRQLLAVVSSVYLVTFCILAVPAWSSTPHSVTREEGLH